MAKFQTYKPFSGWPLVGNAGSFIPIITIYGLISLIPYFSGQPILCCKSNPKIPRDAAVSESCIKLINFFKASSNTNKTPFSRCILDGLLEISAEVDDWNSPFEFTPKCQEKSWKDHVGKTNVIPNPLRKEK